jgi:hypothetical protein
MSIIGTLFNKTQHGSEHWNALTIELREMFRKDSSNCFDGLNSVVKRLIVAGEDIILDEDSVFDFYMQFIVGRHWEPQDAALKKKLVTQTLEIISICTHPSIKLAAVHFLGRLGLNCGSMSNRYPFFVNFIYSDNLSFIGRC